MDDENLRDTQPTLRVDNIEKNLEPFLSDATRELFKRKRTWTSPELHYFGRVIDGEVNVRDFQDFAERLNYLTAQLDGREHVTQDGDGSIAFQPKADALIAPPMSIPLVRTDPNVPRCIFVTYIFVYGLPAWDYSGGRAVYNIDKAITCLNAIVGSKIQAAREGSLPKNSPEDDLPAMGVSRDFHHSQGVEVAAILSGVDLTKKE